MRCTALRSLCCVALQATRNCRPCSPSIAPRTHSSPLMAISSVAGSPLHCSCHCCTACCVPGGSMLAERFKGTPAIEVLNHLKPDAVVIGNLLFRLSLSLSLSLLVAWPRFCLLSLTRSLLLGNHEYDFGPTLLAQRMKESNFPWYDDPLLLRCCSSIHSCGCLLGSVPTCLINPPTRSGPPQ